MAKALNTKNLLALGPERLADLLIEVTKGRADLQRRLRLELSAHQGSEDIARDLRKRYAAIRQAKGYISRKTHRAFAKEIGSFIALIETTVAPADPALGFDLLWELLHLASGVLARTRDTSALLTEAFDAVLPAVARLAPTLALPPDALVDTVFEAVRSDSAGRFAGSVAALAPVLGPQGLAHLDRLAADVSNARGATHTRLRTLRRAVATARNDIDGYIALIPAAERKNPTTAVDIATRLHAVGRVEEALTVLQTAPRTRAVEDQIIACLRTLKRKDDLKALLWDSFTARPDAARLRAYLRLLPDFEDIEAEETARRLAQDHPDRNAALAFFMDWPDLDAAAAVILTHAGALEDTVGAFPAYADALDTRYPLAAVLLRRKAIHAHLARGMAAEDRHAATLLLACAANDARIADYGTAPDHLAFVAQLRRRYAKRKAFWGRV